jgi:DNA-binding transcriptional LysR family regulator
LRAAVTAFIIALAVGAMAGLFIRTPRGVVLLVAAGVGFVKYVAAAVRDASGALAEFRDRPHEYGRKKAVAALVICALAAVGGIGTALLTRYLLGA